ncbi:MAG: hypothetical protein GX900_08390 [Clostridiaceae bacterium]|nr:hypothetical protein [Clostridiaceae bacterium]
MKDYFALNAAFPKFDAKAWVGHYPFRKTRVNTLPELQKHHASLSVTGALISSLDAIFYQDPLEADGPLSEVLADYPQYKQLIAVNPRSEIWTRQIERGLAETDAVGLHLYPCVHDYGFDLPALDALAEVAKERDLPIFISLRIEDARLEYLTKYRQPDYPTVAAWLDRHRDNRICIMGLRDGELLVPDFAPLFRKSAEEAARTGRPNLVADTAQINSGGFTMRELVKRIPATTLCWSSGSPILAATSAWLQMAAFEGSEADRAAIWQVNIQNFLA